MTVELAAIGGVLGLLGLSFLYMAFRHGAERWSAPVRAMAFVRGGSLVAIGAAFLAAAATSGGLRTGLLITGGLALVAGALAGRWVARRSWNGEQSDAF